MAVSVSPRSGVGARLREARRRRGVELEQAALATRIRPRFLRALERDAPPSAFRAPVYARAFLREYATFLGLDPEPLLADYRAAHEEAAPPDLALPEPVRPRRARLAAALLVLLSVGAVVSLAVLGARRAEREAPEVLAPPPEAAAGAEEPVLATPPGREPMRLVLRVVERPTWVRVERGGDVVLKGVQEPGFERTFWSRKRLEVVVADAGAVRLAVGGERLGAPGEDGERYRAGFVSRDGEVRVISR